MFYSLFQTVITAMWDDIISLTLYLKPCRVSSSLSDSKYVWNELWLLKTIFLTVMQHALSLRSSPRPFPKWPFWKPRQNPYIKAPFSRPVTFLTDLPSSRAKAMGHLNVQSVIVTSFSCQCKKKMSDWQVARNNSQAYTRWKNLEADRVYEICDNVSGLW